MPKKDKTFNDEMQKISDRFSLNKINEYFSDDYNINIDKKNIPKEGRYFLYKMRSLFAFDRLSDKKVINALCSAYRQALVYNYDIALEEIKQLIEIKLDNYNTFYYKYDDKEVGFNAMTGVIGINTYDISAILHETGHALHYYNSHDYFPLSILKQMNKASQSESFLKNTISFLKQFDKLKLSIKNSSKIEEYHKKHLDYLLSLNEYNELLNNFINNNLNKKYVLEISDILNAIIDSNDFTYDKYLKLFENDFINTFIFEYIQTYYPSYHAICDMLDAIFKGKLSDGKLYDDNGNKLKKYPGHGMEYYSYVFNRFCEVVANFSVIINSPNNEEMTILLKNIIGEKLYQEIYNFYIKNVLKINVKAESKRRKI